MILKNKVAIVTGAASERSIGWGVAKALAAAGADVVVNDLPGQSDALNARAEEIRTMGRNALAAPADITQPEQILDLKNQTIKQFDRIDIAVSNAGIIRWENFLDITPSVMQSIIDVNIKGNMIFCQTMAKEMMRQGDGGRIIITSSVQAYTHFPVTPVYGGTKHAMHIFVGALALELAPYKITVNHFGPGWVRTALNDHDPAQQTAEDIENQKAAVPLGRAGTIEEMGAAAVYFASPEAAYTTGTFLRVAGGLGIGKYVK